MSDKIGAEYTHCSTLDLIQLMVVVDREKRESLNKFSFKRRKEKCVSLKNKFWNEMEWWDKLPAQVWKFLFWNNF